MREIKLTQDKVALVDDSDYESLSKYKWCVHKVHKRNVYYALRGNSGNTEIKMHRFLINPPKGLFVDHINGDGLDNRRSNLRVCTHSENMINSRSRINSTSIYKCVHWHKRSNKWRVRLRKNGIVKEVGSFKTELEAGIIANIIMRRYHGKFARLNELKKISYEQ